MTLPKPKDSTFARILEREFLDRKTRNAKYSLRAFGRDLGIPVSSLSEILQGKRAPSEALRRRALKSLGMEPPESKSNLPEPADSKSPKTRRYRYHQLDNRAFAPISEWQYFAILSLMETEDFRSDAAWIATRLGISVRKVRHCLSTLLKEGYIKADAKGNYRLSKTPVAAPDEISSAAIVAHHTQCLSQSIAALAEQSPDQRDFTSISMAIDPNLLPEAKVMIRKFGEKLCRFLESGHKREVYRLSINLIGLSK